MCVGNEGIYLNNKFWRSNKFAIESIPAGDILKRVLKHRPDKLEQKCLFLPRKDVPAIYFGLMCYHTVGFFKGLNFRGLES